MSTNKSKKKITLEGVEVVEPVIIEDVKVPSDGPGDDMETPKEEAIVIDPVVEPQAAIKPSMYHANDTRINAYLQGAVAFDKIRQLKKGGPFVGSKGEIFIPLSLIK